MLQLARSTKSLYYCGNPKTTYFNGNIKIGGSKTALVKYMNYELGRIKLEKRVFELVLEIN